MELAVTFPTISTTQFTRILAGSTPPPLPLLLTAPQCLKSETARVHSIRSLYTSFHSFRLKLCPSTLNRIVPSFVGYYGGLGEGCQQTVVLSNCPTAECLHAIFEVSGGLFHSNDKNGHFRKLKSIFTRFIVSGFGG